MKCKSVCNLPETAQISDADGILITQGGKTVRMLMSALRAYIGMAAGAEALGVPVPAPGDGGKVPAVKYNGGGYELTPLASVARTGSYFDLNDAPAIPAIPTSLPANGGNADTLDGYHASAFAPAGSGVGFESWTVTLSQNGESEKAFTGNVQVVLVNIRYKDTGAMISGIWTPETSGIENKMYGSSGGVRDDYGTTVTISGKNVKIKRGGVGSVTHYVTVLTK